MTVASRFRRLPLFWKLLVPYVGLLVVVGALGAFLITRDLASRAQATLNEQLLQASLKARALLHERELYLLESANLAANLEGMAGAIRNRDAGTASRLLRSVLALKDGVSLVAVTSGPEPLVAFARDEARAQPLPVARAGGEPLVAAALGDAGGNKIAGLIDDARSLAIAAPVCVGADACEAAGVALVALRMDRLAEAATGRPGGAGLQILDDGGRVLAATGATPDAGVGVRLDGDASIRRRVQVNGAEAHTLYAPFEVQGRRIGMIAVTLPAEPVFASVRGAAVRLAAILVAALAGVVAVGALLSRLVVGQTRLLLATNRALGQGDLSARAPVVTDDEIGELARGLNQMAEQLQASYATLESRVDQRTEEVRRLLRERTEFFASLSHELRTPIALIISHGEMLLDPDFRSSARTIEQRGEVIRDTGKQLLAVVNDILDLARLEAGSVRVDVVETSVARVVEELGPTIRGLAAGGSLSVLIDVPPDLPPVRADPVRLRTILVNLIDNAVKYTPAGGAMRIAATVEGEHVAISVADTGIGIPPDARERVFEPFFCVPGSETQHGRPSTGLGLAIAKRLADAQAGDLTLQSAPGKGSTFTLRLPVAGSSLIAMVRRSAGRRARRARGDDRPEQAPGRVS